MTTTEIFNIIKGWIILVLGSSYSTIIIRGELSTPKPAKKYFVIHQPISPVMYASGNYSKGRKVIEHEGEPEEEIHGYVDYVNHWQATVSLEEVGFTDNGDKLRELINSLRRRDILSYFRNSKVSILRTENITPIPQLSENIWELRSNVDLIILFPDEGTYEPGIIETVEFEGTYNH